MAQSSLTAWLNKPQTGETALQTGQLPLPLPLPLPTPTPPSTIPNPLPLPVNVEFRACTKEDIPNLKRLTSLLLPIPYPDKFYKDIVEDAVTNNITLLAVWHDDPSSVGKQSGRLVGAIRCRLLAHPRGEPSARRDDKPMLYLSTLAVLSPYRTHGIATQMLRALVKRAVDDYGISHVGAHVWEANIDGLTWYRRRGFREVAQESNYYRRLDPQGAVVVQKEVSVMDLLGKQVD